jgi:hypothetical protein
MKKQKVIDFVPSKYITQEPKYFERKTLTKTISYMT